MPINAQDIIRHNIIRNQAIYSSVSIYAVTGPITLLRPKLHFIPPYCPHLNPIERLWSVMHKHVTHNRRYATCVQFADATLGFLREKVPRNWADQCDSVTDNFHVINPKDFRVVP